MEQNKNTSPIQLNDFKVIFRVLVRNWYFPVIIVPIFYLIGYLSVYKTANVYSASVELLKSNDAYLSGNVITDNQSFYNSSNSYVANSNEKRIITSFDLMKETVEKLKPKLQVSYYLVGRVRTTEQFNGTPFSVQVKNINPSLIEVPIDFKVIDFDRYEISYQVKDQLIIKQGKFNEDLIDINYNFSVSRSSGFGRNAASKLDELSYQIVIHDLDQLVHKFQTSLKVENPDYTNVLVLKMEDIIPQRAILILDTLSQVYIHKSVKSRFDINERTIEFIDKQLEDVSFSLKEVEDTMQSYKRSKGILDLEWERTNFFKKITEFESKKYQLELKITAIDDLERYIIEDKDPEFLPPNVFLIEGDQYMSASISELHSLQLTLNNQLVFAKDDNPSIVTNKNKTKKLKQTILVYLNGTRSATYKKIKIIDAEIDKYASEIKMIPPKQREISSIQRQVDVNEDLYNFLLQKRANIKLAKASIVPEIKVIDSPRNLGVVSPNKQKIIFSFMMIGLAISIVLIVIRLLLFTTIQTAEELKEKSYLPILGDLPFVKELLPIGFIVNEKPSAFISEAFRTIRTNLQYVILNSNKKTILLTSHGPGEGKTFTTINIGAILANSGKKVVMLELDLHKPRIQKALEMNADIGISTFMVGQNTLDEIVKPTIVKNLYTILSGPISPNPSDLILSERLKEIIDYAKANFDFVLMDTPPVSMLADASYLMQYSDINLFVLNTKYANKRVLTLFEKLVEDNSIKDVYMILNCVKRKRNRYYYSRYGWGYGDGYGYSYSNKR